MGAWIARAGPVRIRSLPDAEFAELFVNTDSQRLRERASRCVSRIALCLPFGGAAHLSRSFDEGARRHRLPLGRQRPPQDRRYGGEDVIEAGVSQVGVGHEIPRPEFHFGEPSRDEIEQKTVGAAYELLWKNTGEMSVGVQKTFCWKTGETPAGPLPESRDEPVLINGDCDRVLNAVALLLAATPKAWKKAPSRPTTR